jgi:hypothetical protein
MGGAEASMAGDLAEKRGVLSAVFQLSAASGKRKKNEELSV